MFVVYHIDSTVMLKMFTTESGAKRSTTCMNRNAGSVKYDYATEEIYRTTIVHKVKRVNLMSGKEYFEDSNTPSCCSPSSNRYWSM